MSAEGEVASQSPQIRIGRPTARRWTWRLIFLGSAFAVALILAGYYLLPRKIPTSGGWYFFSERILPVPRFAQSDARWGNNPLGLTPSSLGAEGCAVCSAAMVLSYYGVDVDPGRLNKFLSENEGYTEQGWLYWEKAAAFQPGVARHAYEDLPSYYLMDRNLLQGNPVIVRVHLPNGITHFVVVVGKRGFDYLIQDPASGGEKGVYPLRVLAQEAEALRFYEKLGH
jgi:Peptidase C39 family